MITRRSLIGAGLAFPLAAVALAAKGSDPIKLRRLYEKDGSFSELAKTLQGERIVVKGYMAPPLKAQSKFFVLTRRPISVCPFCETAAEWPDDILAVYTKRVVKVTPFNLGIEVSGVLNLGKFRDEDTGFVSLVRLSDASYGTRR